MVRQLLSLSKAGLIFLIFLLAGCVGGKSKQDFYHDILGLTIEKRKQEYFYEEPGVSNEGFSFEILSFSSKKSNLLLESGYPLTYESKKDWSLVKWRQTPFIDDIKALELLFIYDVTDPVLKIHIQEVKKLIAEEGNYISFFYKNEGGFIYSIELYVVDSTTNRLFIISVLT